MLRLGGSGGEMVEVMVVSRRETGGDVGCSKGLKLWIEVMGFMDSGEEREYR
jgi:hypothetical protein